ncbi:tyrosine-type recombinase/integrase [Cardinium endosymbiont of Culicoides punctatus]|uniref:tyrosine-type recombinase/integrase n=1 Tax=Cardinium endosymbiont of Culicoides punctatus TaxID=2304601 RepID=UPI001058FCB3|nr:tyrosine-type recombinase/integrase [Cardinium endosymbiont of Culicoides punctatus]TDG93369.1 Tyrosine recombinase XerD [Cardinium endosymbiont of Culicoides punctatus]
MDDQSSLAFFEAYLTAEKRASAHTILAYKLDLEQLRSFLASLVIPKSFQETTAQELRSWVMSLVKQQLSAHSINRKLVAIRTFYAFLQKKAWITTNPTAQLRSLKTPKRLPIFFQKRELLDFLEQHTFESTFAGLRDRLVLELLYGTGMRLAELLTLRTLNVNLSESILKVIGKHNKERIIPFPKRPLSEIIASYLLQKEQLGYTTKMLVVTDCGKPCYPMFIYRIVKKYLAPTTRASKHSPHILRHTFATHLLDNGADLQAIKELLGHANLSATQVYTHNSLTKLKEIFKKTHPRAEEEM